MKQWQSYWTFLKECISFSCGRSQNGYNFKETIMDKLTLKYLEREGRVRKKQETKYGNTKTFGRDQVNIGKKSNRENSSVGYSWCKGSKRALSHNQNGLDLNSRMIEVPYFEQHTHTKKLQYFDPVLDAWKGHDS